MKQENYDQVVKPDGKDDRKLQSSIPVCVNCKYYEEGKDCGKYILDEFGVCGWFDYREN